MSRFVTCSPRPQKLYNDQFGEGEIGRTCSTRGEEECMQDLTGKTKRKGGI
jgi:hypothetical protein